MPPTLLSIDMSLSLRMIRRLLGWTSSGEEFTSSQDVTEYLQQLLEREREAIKLSVMKSAHVKMQLMKRLNV